jgi:nucleotide-binding universal stress UspA family protein
MTTSRLAPARSATGRIIVASDNTPAGRAALAWAEAECAADPAGRRLVLCRTYPGRIAGTFLPPSAAIASIELIDPEFARQVHQVRGHLGGERVDVFIRFGDIAYELIAEAGPADLLVTAAPPLGATGLAVTIGAQAGATVVSVRPTPPHMNMSGPFAGHVVVGVDDRGRNAEAIRFAFDYAARHGMPVTAVHAHEPDSGGLWADDKFMEIHPLGHEFGLDLLDAAIATARAEHPDVPVRRAVMRDRAGASLVRGSAGAFLLVVGHRGRSSVVRHLLGSVSRHVLMHARCTVAVVHGGAEHPSPSKGNGETP